MLVLCVKQRWYAWWICASAQSIKCALNGSANTRCNLPVTSLNSRQSRLEASVKEMTSKAVETIDLLLQAHWITPEQIKQFEKEIQEEWKTEPVKEQVSDNSPERVELIKENATLKVRNTDLQAQVEEAQSLISAQWKTIQSLKWNSSVLSDGEKSFVETLRLANDNKENAYYKRNYEIMLKKELEKEWGISLDWIEQQAYMKKSQTWAQPTSPGVSREDEIARQKSAEIQKRLANRR